MEQQGIMRGLTRRFSGKDMSGTAFDVVAKAFE